jgi:hypothetical protein
MKARRKTSTTARAMVKEAIEIVNGEIGPPRGREDKGPVLKSGADSEADRSSPEKEIREDKE